MKKIYIAGPYSLGDVGVNIHNAIKAADELMNAGFAVYCPFLCHFQHLVCPRPYGDWLDHDLEWLPVCDALLRLPGESAGANIEVSIAFKHDIPVYHTIEGLIRGVNNLP